MPRFSSRTIAMVKRNVDGMLTETCTIQRESAGRGTMGETVHVWDTVAVDVACRLIRAGQGASKAIAEAVGTQEILVDEYRLITPAGTPLNTDYRVVVGGKTYQVMKVDDDLTDEVFVSAVMIRVRLSDGA